MKKKYPNLTEISYVCVLYLSDICKTLQAILFWIYSKRITVCFTFCVRCSSLHIPFIGNAFQIKIMHKAFKQKF